MTGTWKRAAIVSGFCLAFAGAASFAQDRPPGPGGPPPGAGPRGHGFDRGKMVEEMRKRHEAMLHDVLSIKPDQEAAFHAYLAAITPEHKGGRPGGRGPEAGGKPPAPPAPVTTPERLDRMAARMAERQARFQKTAAATKAFYAALSPEQRRAFDALPMLSHRGGPMGGHHGFGGRR